MSQTNQELRKVGLKVTLPRVKILQALENADPHHLGADDVFRVLQEAGEEVGLATVYRVLTQFESAGLVERHNFDHGSSVFEIARDDHHDHMVCLDCNRVLEFADDIIESRQQIIAKELGFKLEDHSLHLYGKCLDAQCKWLKSKTKTTSESA